jgi:hypothetical protein
MALRASAFESIGPLGRSLLNGLAPLERIGPSGVYLSSNSCFLLLKIFKIFFKILNVQDFCFSRF